MVAWTTIFPTAGLADIGCTWPIKCHSIPVIHFQLNMGLKEMNHPWSMLRLHFITEANLLYRELTLLHSGIRYSRPKDITIIRATLAWHLTRVQRRPIRATTR